MAASATGVTTHADMFLKLDGIDGESQDSKHKNEIQLQGFSFGAVQPGSASLSGGAGVGQGANSRLVDKQVCGQGFGETVPVLLQWEARCHRDDHLS